MAKLYLADDGSNNLYTVDPDTAATALVGAFGGVASQVTGLAWHKGVLYCSDDATDSLCSINTSTGAATRIGTFGVIRPRSLCSHQGVLYGLFKVGSNNTELHEINTSTGDATRIGEVFTGTGRGMASRSGVLYALRADDDALYSVNTSTAAAIKIGTGLGSGISAPSGMAIHEGALYACDASTGNLYSVDESSGTAEEIGSLGVGTPKGLASNAPYVPPSLVRDLRAAPVPGGTRLEWEAPADDGGALIAGYKVEASLDGSTWATLEASIRVRFYTDSGLSPGTLKHYRVSALNQVGQGPLSYVSGFPGEAVPPKAATAATKPLEARLELLISQWSGAPALRGFLQALLDAKRKGVLEPLAYIESNDDLGSAEGVWLDNIGQLLGLERPAVDATSRSKRFGFDDAGSSFDSVRYEGVEALPVLAPAGDDLYRRLLRARGWALVSVGDIGQFERAALAVDPNAVVTDELNMQIRVRTNREEDMRLADSTRALPRPTGVRLRIVGGGLFGFDDAGLGFDLGRFANE